MPTPWLQGKHSIFGRVTDAGSRAVVDAIGKVSTDPRNDRPVQDVVLHSIEIID